MFFPEASIFRYGFKQSPLPEGEGEGEKLASWALLPLIRPSATFSLMEKGTAED